MFIGYLEGKTHNFDDAGAFSDVSKQLPAHQWHSTWLGAAGLTHLAWFAAHICSGQPTASPAEGNWSTRDWMHSKKRNSMTDLTVNRLVRCHCNLQLQSAFEDFDYDVLPWDIEMVIAEPDAVVDDNAVVAAADAAALRDLQGPDYFENVAQEQQGPARRQRRQPARFRDDPTGLLDN